MKKRSAYVHLYTGNGKGKTTAAMGLALRASGAGWKVCFIQFLKGGRYSEHKILKKIPNLTLKKFGRNSLVGKRPRQEDLIEAQKGLEAVRKALKCGTYNMVVADELLVTLRLGLLTEREVKDCIQVRPENVELILTGRGATPGMKRLADLVTEMKEVRHYYSKGISARRGIEY